MCLVRTASETVRKARCDEDMEATRAAMAETACAADNAPKLVRSLSNTATGDRVALARLVKGALADTDDGPRWAAVDDAHIIFDECSGMGGAKTFKVSVPDQSTPALVLHSRVDEDWGEHAQYAPFFERRQADAQRAFAREGLGPRRLAQGADWFVEPLEGVGQPSADSVEDWCRIGQLLAAVHTRVDPAWFEPHRAEILALLPQLRDARLRVGDLTA
jgi:hypothetical protein